MDETGVGDFPSDGKGYGTTRHSDEVDHPASKKTVSGSQPVSVCRSIALVEPGNA